MKFEDEITYFGEIGEDIPIDDWNKAKMFVLKISNLIRRKKALECRWLLYGLVDKISGI